MKRHSFVGIVGLTLLMTGTLHAADTYRYLHLDAIGNVRVVTDENQAVIERHDYLPFGEECTTGLCASNPGVVGGQPKRFTGKERDPETGLDYFGARYYGSRIGRFTTVDPTVNLRASIVNPQRWNRYAYGLNNPLRFNDPDGREVPVVVDGRMYNMGLEGGPALTQQQATVAGAVYGAGFVGAMGVAMAPLASAAATEAAIALGILGPRVGQMISGPYGQVSRSELEAAAKASGPTIDVLTRQTSAPEAGRALSVAAGEGAEALTRAAREGGATYGAAIPRALVSTMEKAGLAQVRTTTMPGGTQTTEYRFLPQATEFVTKFFEKKQ
jgi:RHS repeat-associated protein